MLVFSSSSLIAIKLFDLNNAVWPIFGRDILPEQFSVISTVVIMFLMLSYLVSWYGDFLGYSKWLKINSVTRNSMDDMGRVRDQEAPIQGVLRRLQQLEASKENAADRLLELDGFTIEDIKSVQGDRNVAKDLETLRSTVSSNKDTLGLLASSCADLEALLLSDLNANFSKITILSRILLFGWYLFFPLVIGLLALLVR